MAPAPVNHLKRTVLQGIRDVATATIISFFVFLGSFFFTTAALYLFVDAALPL